jgi:two-component system sensor histidine kinase AlgZ
MAIQATSPQLKAGFEVLRDSVLIALGLTFVVTMFRSSLTLIVALYMFVEILIYTAIIMFLAYAVFGRLWPLVSYKSESVRWAVFVVVMLAISAVGSIAGTLILIVLRLEVGVPLATMFEMSFRVCAVVSLLIGINEAAFDRLKGQLESTKLKLQQEELERERALKLATEARLGALESRLHPHFLFNTLNSISSLIPSDPVRAERMVERMAALLRFTLDSQQGGLVTVEQEVKIVRDYLEIEQARLGGRLRWGLEMRGEMDDLRIPPLSIQTLVENSIKFAVAPNREGGEVRISAERRNGALRVDVKDTGQGFSLESAPSGHGLDILRSRLAVLFGEGAELSMNRADGWTTVSMKVPA